MRASHFLIPSVFTLVLAFSGASFAFSTEQGAPQNTSTGAQIADPDEQFESKTGTTTGTGFYVTGGVNQQFNNSDSPFDANRPAIQSTPFGYTSSPMFRPR